LRWSITPIEGRTLICVRAIPCVSTYLIVTPGFFVDGVLIDLMDWAYPRPEMAAQSGTYMIGDDSEGASMSWCVASATLLSIPIGMFRASVGASTLV
jgi:hypothetical protein